MIRAMVLAPNEGGGDDQTEAFRTSTWRVVFTDTATGNTKTGHISKPRLQLQLKLNTDPDNVRQVLTSWADHVIREKGFAQLEADFNIELSGLKRHI